MAENDTPKRTEYAGERDMGRFWAAAAPRREPMRQRWYIPGLLALIVASVPFYYAQDHIGRIVGGLPLWVWASLGCSVGVSCLTAGAVLLFWDDDDDAGRGSHP